jgi:hypothetical protein
MRWMDEMPFTPCALWVWLLEGKERREKDEDKKSGVSNYFFWRLGKKFRCFALSRV